MINIAKRNLVKIFLALFSPLLLINCGHSPTLSPDGTASRADGTIKSTIVLGKVGVLSKASAISLRKLILTAVSSATPADTVKDTSTVSGSDQVTVLKVLTLAPLRTWTVNAKTLDQKDS